MKQKKEASVDTSSRKKTEKKSIKEKSPTRKSDADGNNPALQVSSKVLTDKKSNKPAVKKDDSKPPEEDKQNEARSRIPHKFSDNNAQKHVSNEEVSRSEEDKTRTKKHGDYRRKGKIPEIVKSEQSPRKAIPRLCNENTYIRDSSPKGESKTDNSKSSNEISEVPQSQLPDISDKMKDSSVSETGKARKSKRNSPVRKQAEIQREITFSKSEREGKKAVNESEETYQIPTIESTVPEETKIQKSSPRRKKRSSSRKKEQSPKKVEKEQVEKEDIETVDKNTEKEKDVAIFQKTEIPTATVGVGENLQENETNSSKRSERKSHRTKERRSQKKSGKDISGKKEKSSPKHPSDQKEFEQKYDAPGSREDESSNSGNTRLNDDASRQRRRLSETAKSSSLDEGDVRLVIERKADPEFSIKIKMSDKNKKGDKNKETNSIDFSSTQGEGDQSFVKDSGYISTSESVHKHKRSITIDLGHTTAKINAGMKGSSSSKKDLREPQTDSETPRISLPEVDEGNEAADSTSRNKNQNQTGTHKVLPSKLPVLSTHRRRSNSMIIMSYDRTPRRNSISSEVQDSREVQTERSGTGRKRSKGRSSRQIGHDSDKGTGKLSRGSSGIPIYRAQSDSNLQQLGKPSPRFSGQSLSNLSIPDMSNGRMIMSERKMDSIVEHSFSSSDLQSDLIKSESRSPDNLKLPSILLSRPEEAEFFGYHTEGERFPLISPREKSERSSKHSSPVPSGLFTPDQTHFKLPILQTAMRCKCNIEPHQYWDGRRTKSAVDCVANLHFLSEEDMAQFDQRLFQMGRRTSFSSGRTKKRRESPMGYRALRTQTLKRYRSGRRSAESVTFHVDHARERNSFKLPTEKLKKNRKFKVVFTIGKSESQDKEDSAAEKKS